MKYVKIKVKVELVFSSIVQNVIIKDASVYLRGWTITFRLKNPFLLKFELKVCLHQLVWIFYQRNSIHCKRFVFVSLHNLFSS